jgi:hypothetical protein
MHDWVEVASGAFVAMFRRAEEGRDLIASGSSFEKRD